MTTAVYNNCYTCWYGGSANAGDEGGDVNYWIANANRIGIANKAQIANVDIVIARRQIRPSYVANSNVVIASGVVNESTEAVRQVVGPSGVVKERFPTGGRVVGPGGVPKERKSTRGRVVVTSSVKIERTFTRRRVVIANGVVRSASRPQAVLVMPVVLKRRHSSSQLCCRCRLYCHGVHLHQWPC
jgi:hypothetical protein